MGLPSRNLSLTSKSRQLLVVTLLVALTVNSAALGNATVPQPPSVTALHYFVGDPLFDLTGSSGDLFSNLPDQPTAMASTTKIVTLHLAVDALMGRIQGACGGSCHLGDQVTVSANAVLGSSWVPSGSSIMCDAASLNLQTGSCSPGGSLQPGEKVQFGDLLRGMMYPSGNDAAIAIAEYVAGNVETFVELMNDVTLPGHISPQGLPSTHFTNPAGLDDFCPTFTGLDPLDPFNTGTPEFCQLKYLKSVVNIGGSRHYTTARDLARIWLHAMEDDLFRQVVGFQGQVGPLCGKPVCYSFTTTRSTYRFFWGPLYPGWEGNKGGGTTGCGVCEILSANRIGRRLVGAFMQGTLSDIRPLFDYGFAKLFHPDKRAMKADSFVSDDALVVLPNGRVVTAGITSGLVTKLATWSVDVDNSQIAELAETSTGPPANATSPVPQFASLQAVGLSNNFVIVAKTVSSPVLSLFGGSPHPSGSVTLSLWSISPEGVPSVVVQNVPAGQGFNVRLLRASSNMFVTSYVGKAGSLVLKSWQLQGLRQLLPKPAIVNLSTISSSVPVDEGIVTGLGSVGGLQYFATPERLASDGKVTSEIWWVNPTTGEIEPQPGAFVNFQDIGDHLAASTVPVETLTPDELFTPLYFAVGFRTPAGNLRVAFASVSFNFDGFAGVAVAGDTGVTGEAIIGGPSLAPLGGSGLMIDVRDANSNQKLIVWEVQRYGDDTVDSVFPAAQYEVAQHAETGTTVKDVIVLGLPTTHSEGDFVSATLESGTFSGALRLWTWRVGDRPY